MKYIDFDQIIYYSLLIGIAFLVKWFRFKYYKEYKQLFLCSLGNRAQKDFWVLETLSYL